MKETVRYRLVQGPRLRAYEQLVDWLHARSRSMTLVVRDTPAPGDAARAVLDVFSSSCTSAERVSEWPGTLLFDAQATLHRYVTSDILAAGMKRLAGGLYDWCLPSLPEDPCFYREDGSVLFTTIAHERDAYVDVGSDELASLRRAVPDLALREE